MHTLITSCLDVGSDVFSTSTDGQVLWWDIRKLVEPVEKLQLEYANYKPGQLLNGIVLEYESTMVSSHLLYLIFPGVIVMCVCMCVILFLQPTVLCVILSQPSSWWEQSKE